MLRSLCPRAVALSAGFIAVALLAGCATAFSPEMIRGEIVRQSGENPRRAFEVNLGRFTTLLLRQALATDEGTVPLAGLSGLELAVFEIEDGADSPAIDVTRIPVRGWEPVVRLADERRSGMVLVRGSRGSSGTRPRIADLVIVGSGSRQVVYARLWGSLDPAVPEAFGDVLRQRGADGIRNVLGSLADGAGEENRD